MPLAVLRKQKYSKANMYSWDFSDIARSAPAGRGTYSPGSPVRRQMSGVIRGFVVLVGPDLMLQIKSYLMNSILYKADAIRRTVLRIASAMKQWCYAVVIYRCVLFHCVEIFGDVSGGTNTAQFSLEDVSNSDTQYFFLPRDAILKRGLCCRPVSVCPSICLSVRLSRWCIVSTRLKISSNFFLGPVAPSFNFFDPCAGIQFQGEPFSGAQIIRHGKFFFANFNWNRRLSQKRYEIGPWLLWNVNRKS